MAQAIPKMGMAQASPNKGSIRRMAKKKYSVVNELHEKLMKDIEVTRSGQARLKRTALKAALENVFAEAAKHAAGGERVRFPVIGTMARREVKARKGGKG